MAVISRYRSAVSAGVLAAFILVLAFGNPAYVHWAQTETDPDTAGGWFLRLLAWPAWSIDTDDSLQDVFAAAVRAILLIVFTWLFLTLLPGTQLARVRGTISQLFAGWSAYVFAGAFAGLVAAWIQRDPSVLQALQAAGNGAIYGLFTGWIVGIFALGGHRSS